MLFATLALLIENLVGYPDTIYRRIGHPVEWMGRLIAFLDARLNTGFTPNLSRASGRGGFAAEPQSRRGAFHDDQSPSPALRATSPAGAGEDRIRGVVALVVLILAVGLPALALQWATMALPYGWVVNVLLAVPFLAQKSLRDHVQAVADAFPSIPDARDAVSRIVGRDPSQLDESAISKAALESLAENTSDGVVAPALWYAIAGLPGLVIYKAINTADSMIGHRSDKYLHFGWAAARLDDLVNLPASRLTGALFAVAAWFESRAAAQNSWQSMMRDAGRHQSPNAGWPESAMAGALGVRFGGPRSYEGEIVDLPWMGDGRSELTRGDIGNGLALFDRTMAGLPFAFAALAPFL